jgi:hypothetical protein
MMSADDAVLTGAAILGASSWLVWLRHMLKVRPLDRRAHPSIAILGLTLLACTAVILAVLNTAASYDVVDAPVYQFMYLVIGLTARLVPVPGNQPARRRCGARKPCRGLGERWSIARRCALLRRRERR